MSSNEPLYVIDDVPIQAGRVGACRDQPHDIESIAVRRIPGQCARGRGANGVIVIDEEAR
jgi:hypothetical protein